MATPRPSYYALTIRYGEKNKPFHFSGDELVSDVVRKASSHLQISFSEREKLILVHLGSQLPNDSTLKEALKDSVSTCCFLQISSRSIVSSLTASLIEDCNNREYLGKCLGYCVECNMVVRTSPEYKCSVCKGGNFVLDSQFNIFDDDRDKLIGRCDDCNKQVKPTITHNCAANISPTNVHCAVFLPHLRQNVLNLPCMKCEKTENELIKFHCNHTMCRYCFGTMCTMLLGVGAFVSHPTIGYSIGCPGGGKQCSKSLITDPHHFYLVEGRKGFYEKYQARAFHEFNERERGPKCQKCPLQLDMHQGLEAEVFTPANLKEEKLSAEAGGAWFSFIKLFKRKESEVKVEEKKMRQQIKCRGCQSLYCGECTLIWHEGACIRLSTEQQDDANKFKVDLKKAAASEWK